MGRSRRRRTAVVLLAPVLVLVGCGSNDSVADREPTTTRAPGPATELPAGYRDGRLVGTAHHVVRLPGDQELDAPSAASFRRLDLRNGRDEPLDRPPAVPQGRELVLLQQAVGLDDAVLQATLVCDAPYLDDAGDGDCRGPRFAFHRIDPASGTWSRTTLPTELEDVDAHSVALLQALPGDRAVAVVWAAGADDGRSEARTLVLAGTRWRQVGDPGPTSYGLHCATATELVDLAKVPDPQPGDQPGVGTVALRARARSLATGAWRDLPRPPIDGSYGGVGVEVACGTAGVALASKGPGLGGPGSVVVLDGDRWVTAEGVLDPVAPIVPGDAWSGGPVAVLGMEPPTRPPSDGAVAAPRSIVVVDGSGRARLEGADGSLDGADLVALGTTGRFLVLGPSTSPTERDEAPDAGRPIPLRTLDLT